MPAITLCHEAHTDDPAAGFPDHHQQQDFATILTIVLETEFEILKAKRGHQEKMKPRFCLYFAFLVAIFCITPDIAKAGEEETRFNKTTQQADRGDPSAQFALGNLYAQGDGTEQDYVKAHVWFNLAAAADHAEARNSRDIFSQLMTPAQVAEAQRLAREWFAQHKGGEK